MWEDQVRRKSLEITKGILNEFAVEFETFPEAVSADRPNRIIRQIDALNECILWIALPTQWERMESINHK